MLTKVRLLTRRGEKTWILVGDHHIPTIGDLPNVVILGTRVFAFIPPAYSPRCDGVPEYGEVRAYVVPT